MKTLLTIISIILVIGSANADEVCTYGLYPHTDMMTPIIVTTDLAYLASIEHEYDDTTIEIESCKEL